MQAILFYTMSIDFFSKHTWMLMSLLLSLVRIINMTSMCKNRAVVLLCHDIWPRVILLCKNNKIEGDEFFLSLQFLIFRYILHGVAKRCCEIVEPKLEDSQYYYAGYSTTGLIFILQQIFERC